MVQALGGCDRGMIFVSRATPFYYYSESFLNYPD